MAVPGLSRLSCIAGVTTVWIAAEVTSRQFLPRASYAKNNQQAMDPNGKVALVTGGASGIGLAFVKELLKNGANVAVCDVNAQIAKESMKEITETFGKDRAIFVQMDVTKEDEFENAFQSVKRTFGQLDIVANNAGILDDIHWEKTVQINLNGTIRGTLLALKHMGKDNGGNGGVIVNTSSIAGVDCGPYVPLYSATKHGVAALTRCFGLPFHYDRTGVRVLAICPGSTLTSMFDTFMDRLMSKEWVEHMKVQLQQTQPVPAESVGKSFIQLIRKAESGSVWVSEENETYEVNYLDRQAMRRKP